jgi:TonB family protein
MSQSLQLEKWKLLAALAFLTVCSALSVAQMGKATGEGGASVSVTLLMQWRRGGDAHYGSNFVYLHIPCQDSSPCECSLSFKATNSHEFADYISSFGEHKVPVVFKVFYGADDRATAGQLVNIGTWGSERFAHNDQLMSVSAIFRGGTAGERQNFKLRGLADCFPLLNKPDAISHEGDGESVLPAAVPKESGSQEGRREVRESDWLTISRSDAENLLTKKVQPEYPRNALASRIQGMVLLNVKISETGNVIGVSPVSGHPLLLQAAIEAVMRWTYSPYLIKGSAVPVQTQVRVDFRLPPK